MKWPLTTCFSCLLLITSLAGGGGQRPRWTKKQEELRIAEQAKKEAERKAKKEAKKAKKEAKKKELQKNIDIH